MFPFQFSLVTDALVPKSIAAFLSLNPTPYLLQVIDHYNSFPCYAQLANHCVLLKVVDGDCFSPY